VPVGTTMDAFSWTLYKSMSKRVNIYYLRLSVADRTDIFYNQLQGSTKGAGWEIQTSQGTYVAGSQRVRRLRCVTASRDPSRLNDKLAAALSLFVQNIKYRKPMSQLETTLPWITATLQPACT
jgi:hypothetical protein